MRRTKRILNQTKPEWLGKTRQCTKLNPFTSTRCTYEGVKFDNLSVYVGDYVLVKSNADADEPADTLEGCDVARIEHLFKSTDRKADKYRANVQWYSIPSKMPESIDSDVMDDKYEVVEDCRKFDSNVSVETIYKKCSVIYAYQDEIPEEVYLKNKKTNSVQVFVCRYRLRQIRPKFVIEPVLKLDDMSSEEADSSSTINNWDKRFLPNSIVNNEKEEDLSKRKKELKKKPAMDLRSDSSTPNKSDSRLRSAFRKCSIDSDSESPKTLSSTKHSVANIQDSDYENSPQSTPRKISLRRSSRKETPLKSNRFNTFGLERNNSNAEIDQSQIIARVNYLSNTPAKNSDTNVVVKDTPTKTYINSPRRKRKVFRSSSEESLEPRSPSVSPKINCVGPPSVYKLYQKNGQSFIIKKPIDIERKDSKKKLDDSSISCLLSSDDSDSDTILKTLKKSGTKIVARSKSDDTGFELVNTPNKNVGLLENINEHDEAATPKSARRNLSQTLGIKDRTDERKDLLLKKIADKREDASLRIKLRRSSEQSNYKIDSDSDNNSNNKSRRRIALGTPKSILKVDSKGPGTPSVQFSNKDEINEYSPTTELSEKLLKVELKLKRVDTQGVRTSSRNKKANSRYSDYYEIVKTPIANDETPNKRVRKTVNYCEDESPNTTPRRTRSSKSNSEQVKTPNKGSETNGKNSTRMITNGMEDVEQIRTPRKSKRTMNTDDITTPSRKGSRTEEIEPVTPKRNIHTPKLQTPSRSVRTGLLTPSMRQRIIRTAVPSTPLQEARARLHVSAVPKSLPCREEEFNNIYTFLEGKLIDNSGGCLYISGVPGTGKTATVNEVIRCLKKSVSKGQVSNFDFIEINAMKLTEPRQAYVEILKQLTGKKSTWEQAQQLLDKRFTTASPRRLMTLLLVDELDILCNKRQDVVYNLLDWPAKSSARLVVITIANTMDLPERVLMGRVTSRLGLTRLTFQPYTHKQLQEIVTARLNDSHAFKSEAVQLVARKVAAVSGDARRALDICRRATEVAEINNSEIVSMQDVNEALTEMIASVKVQAIRHCSEMEQTFLQAVCSEVARTGVEEVIFKNIYIQLQSLCSLEGLEEPSVTDAMTICAKLGAYRLLICEHSRADIHQRVLLNVSSDDVYFALQNIEV